MQKYKLFMMFIYSIPILMLPVSVYAPSPKKQLAVEIIDMRVKLIPVCN